MIDNNKISIDQYSENIYNNNCNNKLNLNKNNHVLILNNTSISLNIQNECNESEKILEKIYNENKTLISEEKYRFVILALACLVNFMVGFVWTTFSTISVNFSKYFNIPNIQIDYLTNTYCVAYIIFNFPICYIIKNVNFPNYKLMIGSSLLLLIGCFIRTWVNYSIVYAYIGQIFCAITQPIIFNLNSKLVSDWFRSNIRLIALSFLFAVNSLGIVVVFYLPIICFSKNTNKDKWLAEFNNYISIPCYLSICISILVFALMKEKPNVPPSITAINDNNRFSHGSLSDIQLTNNNTNDNLLINQKISEYNKNNNPYSEEIIINNNLSMFQLSIKMLKNKNFVMLLLYFNSIELFFNLFNTSVDKMLNYYNFSDNNANILNGLNNFAGIIGIMLVGFLGAKIKKYKLILIVLNLLIIINYLTLTLFLEFRLSPHKYFWIYFTIFFIMGLTIAPSYLIPIDFAIEIIYPINECISTGFLFWFSQVATLLFIYFMDMLINKNLYFYINLMFLGLFIISQVSSFIVKGKLINKYIYIYIINFRKFNKIKN